MTVKAALAGAAVATLVFVLAAGTSSSATRTVTGFAGLGDNRDGMGLDSCCQDFGVLRFEGGAAALSLSGDDPMTASFGDGEADAALQQPASLPDNRVDRAPGSGAAIALALGVETSSDSIASSRRGDGGADTPDNAGVADVAAPSIWTQMLASIMEFSANATGSGSARKRGAR